MASITDKYFKSLNNMDRDDYLSCFSEDAVVMDPYGSPPFAGKEALNAFMDTMQKTWTLFEMDPGRAFASGDRVAMTWDCTATAKNGKTADFSGINVFTLNEAGLISRVEAYWDFEEMAEQIS
jgi:steroid delta-isomerase